MGRKRFNPGNGSLKTLTPRLLPLLLIAPLFIFILSSSAATGESGPAANPSGCEAGRPNLVVDYKYTYWASPADYLLRRLSVITILKNSGTLSAYDVKVLSGSAGDGVTVVSDFPIVIGDFAPGQSRSFKIVYQVPLLVSSFHTTTSVSALDGCGRAYPYSYETENLVTLWPQ